MNAQRKKKTKEEEEKEIRKKQCLKKNFMGTNKIL